MVTSNTNANVEAARTIAAELGQPTRGKGVDRLAAALVEAVNADITEQEACARLAKIPGAAWVYASVNCGYSTAVERDGRDELTYSADAVIGGVSVSARNNIGFLACVEEIETNAAEKLKAAKRFAAVTAIAEKMIAEQEAAERAEQATAALDFRPDGSPADALPLPVDPFDGVSPADGGGR